MTQQTLVFANFLAPALFPTYQYVTAFIEQRTGIPARLVHNASLADLASGQIDGGFICGLAYTRLAQQHPGLLELSAAPLLQGARYQQQPCYFSDVIVRKESQYRTFQDLQGCNWAYNEKASHSGYVTVCYSLLVRGYASTFFGQTLASGSHARSLHMVLTGQADVAAIDSHLLDFILRYSPETASHLRMIDALGPSTVPPVVVAARLDATIKQQIQAALLAIHQEPLFANKLHDGIVERFIAVEDAQYDDIRLMDRQVQGHFMVH
jgi:phosphonate transport system substrate-binding protein